MESATYQYRVWMRKCPSLQTTMEAGPLFSSTVYVALSNEMYESDRVIPAVGLWKERRKNVL